MQWFKQFFSGRPSPASAGRGENRDLAVAVTDAERMLSTLIDAYGDDSPLVRQQRGYVAYIRRELSARRAA